MRILNFLLNNKTVTPHIVHACWASWDLREFTDTLSLSVWCGSTKGEPLKHRISFYGIHCAYVGWQYQYTRIPYHVLCFWCHPTAHTRWRWYLFTALFLKNFINITSQFDVCVTVHHWYNNTNDRLDETITNFVDNYNQLNMFRAIISPILRSTRLCLQFVV